MKIQNTRDKKSTLMLKTKNTNQKNIREAKQNLGLITIII